MIEKGTHEQKVRDGVIKVVKCEYMRCKNTSGKCKSQNHACSR